MKGSLYIIEVILFSQFTQYGKLKIHWASFIYLYNPAGVIPGELSVSMSFMSMTSMMSSFHFWSPDL